MRSRKAYTSPKIIQPGGFRFYKVWLLALIAGGMFLAGWYMGDSGQVGNDYGDTTQDHTTNRLRGRIDSLEGQRSALSKKVAVLERAAQVDRVALAKAKEVMQDFQRKRLEQEKELAFLRGIVSTESKQAGLRLKDFRLLPTTNAATFKYQFTVRQVLKNIGVATGRIKINIEGMEGEEKKLLPLKQVGTKQRESVKMRFRYFQNVEGEIQLPKGFKPSKFNIEVDPTNKKLAPVKKSFGWVVAEG